MNFQEFLKSKNIDAAAFKSAEPAVYSAWETEFSQMHPNSFTVQKLNLINPIRRKYRLKQQANETTSTSDSAAKPLARPMIKPKPKIN